MVLAIVAGLGLWHVAPNGRTPATVVEVIDGDTISVRVGDQLRTVRLLGIDTPETKHPTKGVECFGPEASAFTAAELLGATVELEYDVQRRDQYGRDLAWIHRNGERFNDRLVREGYARVLLIAPNGAHGRALVLEQLDARRAGRGLWAAC